MSLLEEVRQETRLRGHPCRVGDFLAGLTGKDREDLEAALADRKSYDGSAIGRVITRRLPEGSRPIHGPQVQKHRARVCACYQR